MKKAATRKKKPVLRLSLPANEYKHVPHDGYITAVAKGDIFLPRTATQRQVQMRGVDVHIDVRDKAVQAGPYAPPPMHPRPPSNTYMVVGFYDPSLTFSRQSRRIIILLDGHITLIDDDNTATYYVLEHGTKIITNC